MTRVRSSTMDRSATAWRVTDIVAAVAAVTGLAPGVIRGQTKTWDVVPARHAVVRIARRIGRSYPEISRVLGSRDHSTIVAAQQSAQRLIASEHPKGRAIASIEAEATRRLEEAQSAFEAVLAHTEPVAEVQAAVATASVAIVPQGFARRPGGYVNRRGEIIVAPTQDEVFEDRWQRQREARRA
jgi:hypothetical protein